MINAVIAVEQAYLQYGIVVEGPQFVRIEVSNIWPETRPCRAHLWPASN